MSGPGHVLQVSGTLTTYELTDARCGTVDSSTAFDTGVVYPDSCGYNIMRGNILSFCSFCCCISRHTDQSHPYLPAQNDDSYR
jgi:hypothetical protein